MIGNFTAACAAYYRSYYRWLNTGNHAIALKQNVLTYTGQTHTADLDAILDSEWNAEKAWNTATETELEWQKAKWLIIDVMEYFGIPANTKLTVTIPHEMEFELWLDDDKWLHFEKTADLSGGEDEDIIILSGKLSSILDDDDEDEEPGKKLFIYTRRTGEGDEYFVKKSRIDGGLEGDEGLE